MRLLACGGVWVFSLGRVRGWVGVVSCGYFVLLETLSLGLLAVVADNEYYVPEHKKGIHNMQVS